MEIREILLKIGGIGLILLLFYYEVLPMWTLIIIPILVVLPDILAQIELLVKGEEHHFIILDKNNNARCLLTKRTKESSIKINQEMKSIDLNRKLHFVQEGYANELKVDQVKGDVLELVSSMDFEKVIRSNVLEKLFVLGALSDKILYILIIGGALIILNIMFFYMLNEQLDLIIKLVK